MKQNIVSSPGFEHIYVPINRFSKTADEFNINIKGWEIQIYKYEDGRAKNRWVEFEIIKK